MKSFERQIKKNILINALVYFIILELTFLAKHNINSGINNITWHIILAVISLGLNYISFFMFVRQVGKQSQTKKRGVSSIIFLGFPVVIWLMAIGILVVLVGGYSGQLWILISTIVWIVFLVAFVRSIKNEYTVSKYVRLLDLVMVYVFFAAILLAGYFLRNLNILTVIIIYLISILAVFRLKVISQPFFYIINLIAILFIYMAFVFINLKPKMLYFREAIFFTDIYFLFSSFLRLIELGQFNKDNIFQTIMAFIVVVIVTLGG